MNTAAINANVDASKWSYTAESTPDGEFVTHFCLWCDGLQFARIPAEASPAIYAQEDALRRFCAAEQMLGALKDSLALLEYMAAGRESAMNHKTLVAARAAIAKATGQQ